MHKALKTLLVSVLIGLSFGGYLYLFYDHRVSRIFISLVSSVSIGALMMTVIYARRYLIGSLNQAGIKMVVIIMLLIIAALMGSEITLICRSFLLEEPYLYFSGGNVYMLNILVVLVAGLPIYVNEESRTTLNAKILQQQYQMLKLEQQKTRFELELLRSKINPHFLYNVHNTIAGLISNNPAKAEEMVILLSRFFRFSLSKDSATFHPISDEIAIITTYLDMQKIRYGDRMTYQIHADPKISTLLMPSFILQPLVENAVKHGIEPIIEDGTIEVIIKEQDTFISIDVKDSGAPFSDRPGSGMGLQMVINKLQLLYGVDYKLDLTNTPHKAVKIIFPKKL